MAAHDLNLPSSLPPYPEMIYTAIDALREKMGSNKTTISSYIEARYVNLPAGHATLLKHHLNSMKEHGELIFWKNNYMKPDPNFIRRGRGRPRKPKDGEASVESTSPPLCYPPPVSAAGEMALTVPFKKKETRGRPRKYPRPEDLSLGIEIGDGSELALGTGPRKKGRPPKKETGCHGEEEVCGF